MRLVLDTNVFVSGVFFGGVPGKILSAWIAGRLSVVLSPGILSEYRRVGEELSADYPKRAAVLGEVFALIAANAVVVDAPPLPEAVSRDPSDDMFIAAALASQARIVVSGDRDLLAISGWRDIRVCTPREFHDEFLVVDS